jgi:uroporphyrin-III C-methyltransferase
MSSAITIKTVTLAGAGPGDEELITVKLQKRLATADVIITDRLVNPAIIKHHAHANALVILAGKEGFNDASYTQQEINELIIKYAQEGKAVLRLKGGDIAFFSNVLDELQTLVAHQIPFEIIPGITAASGASAYTGIPLTARGYAQGVQFITFNPNSNYTSEQWKALATTNDTLVCYMASKNLAAVVKSFLESGAEAQKPIAVIEQATTSQQKLHISSLIKCISDFSAIQFQSPSLVIIGNVVSLHDKFHWFVAEANGSVFSELEK